MVVFEIATKIGKMVRLTEVQWAHMSSKHPELVSQVDKMVTTLEEPDFVYHSPGEDCFHYVRLFKQTPVSEKHLLLVVRHLNDEGFIITGFFVPRLKMKDKVLVYGKKNLDKLR